MTKTYTYIGGGEDSPQLIDFMGKQTFLLGEETEVTDANILKKIENNQCFVEGSIDRKKIVKNAIEAKKTADAQRKEDLIVNARELKRRKNNG